MHNFPKLANKHRMKPIVTPTALVAGIKKRIGKIPERAVFIYHPRYEQKFIGELQLAVHDDLTRYLLNPKRTYYSNRGELLVSVLPIGAPTTAVVTEELGALGVTEFLLLGSAGGLSPRLSAGDLVLCTKAVRDEGTSHHYLANSTYSTPDLELTNRVGGILRRLGYGHFAGPTWTVDAPYMETNGEVAHYRRTGVLTVEMEASALFAVGKKRGYKTAAVFAVSDILDERGWSGFVRDLDLPYSKLVQVAVEFAKHR